MGDDGTLFRCVLERIMDGDCERKDVEVWAGWPGTAREVACSEPGGWRVVEVGLEFTKSLAE